MEESIFHLIIQQLKEFDSPINVVHLFGLGEPMLNSSLPDFVQELKETGVAKEVAVTSNGSKLDENLSKRLVDAGLDRLSISLNGIEDKHFEDNVGRKISFSEMYRQIQYFYSIRQGCHLHIKINGECFTEEEQFKFIELFKGCCDTLNIDHVVNVWSGITVKENNRHVTMYEMGRGGLKAEDDEGYICPQMFYELMIHSDGSVSPCCVDYNYKNENLGNVREHTLKEIWNGKEWFKLRFDALNRKYSYEICKTCTYPVEAATVNLLPYRQELLKKYTL